MRGDRFDGHAFVRDVRDRGAVAALVSSLLPDVPADLGLVEVPDTLEGLQRFAATYRKLLSVRTIGVTGSSGKTSTKEFIAAVLSTRFRTKATKGNLNNHIGVPLTLLDLEEDDEFGVVEMGMSHPGEIGVLARMAAPEMGVISSIGPAHIEFFLAPGRHCGGKGGADRGAAAVGRGHHARRRRMVPADRLQDPGARGLGRFRGRRERGARKKLK